MYNEHPSISAPGADHTGRRYVGSALTEAVQGADTHYLMACISYGIKDYASAERSLEAALTYRSDCDEVLALYAEVLWRLNKREQARRVLARGLALNGRNHQLLILRKKMRDSRS